MGAIGLDVFKGFPTDSEELGVFLKAGSGFASISNMVKGKKKNFFSLAFCGLATKWIPYLVQKLVLKTADEFEV